MSGTAAPIYLMMTIVGRGQGEKLDVLRGRKSPALSFLTMGIGTAGTDILNLLGLDTSDKDVILSLLAGSAVPGVLNQLQRRTLRSGGGQNRGVAVTIPLSGISAKVHTAVLHAADNMKGKDLSMNDDRYSLVLITANPGYTDDMMKAARSVGATGGTVLHSRGLGGNEIGDFLRIQLQEEKEILAIITAQENKNAILTVLNEKFGLRTEAEGMVIALPVEDFVSVEV